MSDSILVTGGTGYVGSHTAVELVEAGYHVVVLDNLINSSIESIERASEITGKKIPAYVTDLLDKKGLQEIFSKVMQEYGVYNLVFSSSATVYGDPQYLPLDEKHPVGGCTNPYGKTKFYQEELLRDLAKADTKWNIVLLRYFNPVGAHVSGKIGEDPQGIPNNLVPYISQVASGRLKELNVFGNDYDTRDGTGVRDYIHVLDLSQAHVAALKKIDERCGCKAYNLGTGKCYSVLEMIKTFEKASGKPVPYKIVGRRDGDVATLHANAKLAEKEMGWKAKLDVARMCEDMWRWQTMNPAGFRKAKN